MKGKKKNAPSKKPKRAGAKKSTGRGKKGVTTPRGKTRARKAGPSGKNVRAKESRDVGKEKSATKYRETEQVVGERELVIRGYWDRYPSSDQRKHHKKYDAISKDQRRGPTAYDLLIRDYNSFTAAERKKLRVRVVYGVAPDTGQILSSQKISASGLSLDLHPERSKALLSLQSLLVRSGVVDSPKEWRVNRNAARIEHHVPLGVQWVVVRQEKETAKGKRKRDAQGRFLKSAK